MNMRDEATSISTRLNLSTDDFREKYDLVSARCDKFDNNLILLSKSMVNLRDAFEAQKKEIDKLKFDKLKF